MPSKPPSAPTGSAEEIRVALIASEADRSAAAQVHDFLIAAGVQVDDDAPIAVVLASADSVLDPGWHLAAVSTGHLRQVVVRLNRAPSETIPAQLTSVNFIEWDGAASADDVMGRILGTVLSDPHRMAHMRRLGAEADAWERAKHNKRFLIQGVRRSQESWQFLMSWRESYGSAPPQVEKFVTRSRNRARRSRARWGLINVVVWLATVSAVAGAIALLPKLTGSKHAQFQGFTSGSQTAVVGEPKWASLEAAALIIDGLPSEVANARHTLSQTLGTPWGADITVSGGYSIEALQPLNGGFQTTAVVRSAKDGISHLAVFDVKTGTVRWQVVLGPGEFDAVDVTGDGGTAVAAGSAGIAVIDLQNRRSRMIAPSGKAWGAVCISGQDEAVVASSDGVIAAVNLTTGAQRTVGTGYGSILDLRTSHDGRARALVMPTSGDYILVDDHGRHLAEARITAPLIPVGAVDPSADDAFVAGDDHMLWRITASGSPVPTGVAVPDRTDTMAGLSGNLIAVGGQDQPVRIIDVTGAISLGVICQGAPRVLGLEPAHDSQLIGCFGQYADAIWPVPDGPEATRSVHLDTAPTASSGGTTVTLTGHGIRIGSDASTQRSLTLFSCDATAVSVSPDGTQALVGSRDGDVALVSTAPLSEPVLIRWHVPDSATVQAAGWGPGSVPTEGPAVRTADGNIWDVPPCPDCGSDSGLLNLVRERFAGCWSDTQFQQIGTDIQHAFGLVKCAGLPAAVGR